MKRVGSSKYAVKFFFFTFDATSNNTGSGEVNTSLTVDDNELHGSFTVKIIDQSGTVLDSRSGTVKFTRIEGAATDLAVTVHRATRPSPMRAYKFVTRAFGAIATRYPPVFEETHSLVDLQIGA